MVEIVEMRGEIHGTGRIRRHRCSAPFGRSEALRLQLRTPQQSAHTVDDAAPVSPTHPKRRHTRKPVRFRQKFSIDVQHNIRGPRICGLRNQPRPLQQLACEQLGRLRDQTSPRIGTMDPHRPATLLVRTAHALHPGLRLVRKAKHGLWPPHALLRHSKSDPRVQRDRSLIGRLNRQIDHPRPDLVHDFEQASNQLATRTASLKIPTHAHAKATTLPIPPHPGIARDLVLMLDHKHKLPCFVGRHRIRKPMLAIQHMGAVEPQVLPGDTLVETSQPFPVLRSQEPENNRRPIPQCHGFSRKARVQLRKHVRSSIC